MNKEQIEKTADDLHEMLVNSYELISPYLKDNIIGILSQQEPVKGVDRQKLMDKIEEIQDRNYQNFKGVNEADLHIREEVADLLLPHLTPNNQQSEAIGFADWLKENDYKKTVDNRWYNEVNNLGWIMKDFSTEQLFTEYKKRH